MTLSIIEFIIVGLIGYGGFFTMLWILFRKESSMQYSHVIWIVPSIVCIGVIMGVGESVIFEDTKTEIITEMYNIHDWYYPDHNSRAIINIDRTVNTELDNFQLYVDITNASIAANARADGSDILFSATDGTQLDSRIINYGLGRVMAWVHLPVLSNDTKVHMYMDSTKDTIHTWNPDGVVFWADFQDGLGDVVNPYRTVTNAGVRDVSLFGGFIGQGMKVYTTGGTSSYLNYDGVGLPAGASDKSLSLWVFTEESYYSGTHAIIQAGNNSARQSFGVDVINQGLFIADSNSHWGMGGFSYIYSWHYITLSYSNNEIRGYFDGVWRNTLHTTLDLVPEHILIGSNGVNNLTSLRYDEIMIHDYARSAEDITISYSMMSNPNDFYSLATFQTYDEVAGVTASTVTSEVSSKQINIIDGATWGLVHFVLMISMIMFVVYFTFLTLRSVFT